ncbi:hypothetical protein PLESTB_000316300 [Pleodorina starrii]|uniref:Tim44-like domain-containing protein n=1 Tax=Pleodorina starrii TaxID=330485 RepID=A0A9W6EYK8_9CHLO|nr:hypothetical protein PLESTM_001738100 [Pleodorina starrii]GLC49857.1 hypothetical protein PLESTB_000316300 [Pleodorina starrii]GLC68266.1 hypothetical protein PLESTF_000668400 [Pleodorina starrii]
MASQMSPKLLMPLASSVHAQRALLSLAQPLACIGTTHIRGLTTSRCGLSEQQKSESAEARTSGGSQQQEQQQQASSSSSDQAQNFYNTFKAGYEHVKSKTAGAAGGASGQEPAAKRLLQTLAQDLREVLLPAQDISSATRAYTGPVATATYDGPTALVLARQQATGWQKAWDTVQEKLGGIPLVGKFLNLKVTDTAAYKKGQELVEDLKDKYETSDHPVVHKVEDIKSRMFTGSEASRAMREIRVRDPAFDMNRFVQSVKLDAPSVVRAFLKHDLETLSQHCGPELLERFAGIFKHFDEQGVFEDPSILFIGDVEIVEVRLMDDDPFIIAQFHCQQLKCTRDKFGNVIDGSANQIQRVYYFWGLQQERSPVVTAEGKVLPPRWVIKDMMWQSMLALV